MTAITSVQTAVGSIDFLLPNFPGIPSELHLLPVALWKAELELDNTGKPLFKPNGRPRIKKAPRNSAGFNISKNRPEEWTPFSEVESTFKSEKFTGIGVLMQANSGLVGIDLDDVGDLFDSNPQVKSLVDRAKDLGVYCEKSPSSTGLRMFVRGQLPGHAGKRKGGIELYSSTAFLTLTGEHEWPGEIKEGQWLINALLEVIGSTTQRMDLPHIGPSAVHQAADPSIVETLTNWASQNHPRLWYGPWDKPLGILDDKRYPSQSEADMALVGHLAREALRLGCPPESATAVVLNTFARSCLYREKKKLQVETYAIPKALQSALAANLPATPNPTDLTRNHGDVLTGRLFAQMWKDRFVFVAKTGKWLRWDIESHMWVWCHMGEELHACKEVAQELLMLGGKTIASDPSEGKRLLSIGTKAHDLKRLEAMLKLAPTEPEMSVLPTELDSDPWLLGAQNGVIDLRTGELIPNQPKHLITRRCDASYDKEAKCDLWLKFLGEIFSGDQETIDTIQRALGYTLTGVVDEEVLFICHGFGSNGKSVFNNVFATILGSYGRVAPSSLLIIRRDGDTAPRNDLAGIAGARYVSINELQSGDRLDEQVVKLLAGREAISARFLYHEHFEFNPTFKPWLRTNHKPIITGDDDGIWRRLVLIHFAKQFIGSQRDPHLEEKLLSERDGIMAWMVQGALKWKEDGLRLSPSIQRDCASYRKDSDLLGEFIGETCRVEPTEKVEQTDFYLRYKIWSESGGVRPMSKVSFTRKLAERGHKEARSNGRRFYCGLAIAQKSQTVVTAT